MTTAQDYSAQNATGGAPPNQAGAVDNRMSLQAGDFPIIEDWKDDASYTVKATIRQISPGEFEVVNMESLDEGAPGEKTEPDEGGEPQMGETGSDAPVAGSDYPNPAVRNMMKRAK